MIKKVYKEILSKLGDLNIDFKVTNHNENYITIETEDTINWAFDGILMFNIIELEFDGDILSITFNCSLLYHNIDEEFIRNMEWEY